MGNTEDRFAVGGSSFKPAKVSDTGVGQSDDENIVMRVKDVQQLYGGEAADITQTVNSQTAVLKKKHEKRRKHVEEISALRTTKKIRRTKKNAGVEEETITLNLRKSDTTIDVVVKSPVKKKRGRRGLTWETEGENCTATARDSILQGRSQTGVKKNPPKSTNSNHVSLECATQLPERTQPVDGRTKGKRAEPVPTGALSRIATGTRDGGQCLKRVLLDREATTSARKKFRMPGSNSHISAEDRTVIVNPELGGGNNKKGKEVETECAIDRRQQQLKRTEKEGVSTGYSQEKGYALDPDLERRASLERRSSSVHGVNPFAANEAVGMSDVLAPGNVMSTQEKSQLNLQSTDVDSANFSFAKPGAGTVHGDGVDKPLTNVDREEEAREMPDFPPMEDPLIADVVEDGGLQIVSSGTAQKEAAVVAEVADMSPTATMRMVVQEYRKKPGEGITGGETATSVTEVISPTKSPTRHVCQTPVPDRLAVMAQVTERSRSPSTCRAHVSPPHGSPHSRPPRHIGTRNTPSPTAFNVLAIPKESTSVQVGLQTKDDVANKLENLLSQLPADQVAAFFSRKSAELQVNLGRVKEKRQSPRGKEKVGIESSKSDIQRKKKEADAERKRKKEEAEAQKRMDAIDSQLLKLQAERVELQCGGKMKGKFATPSPRESSKGGRSKTPLVPEISNDMQVCLSRGGRGWNSGSVDSSSPSLHEGHLITDPHSIGIWDTVKDVPPCEVNSVGHPIGSFWKHMQSYTHDRAPWLFEWDLNWTHQPKEMKRRFADRIKQLYPGNYDMDFVLEDVGANIRQRRQRIRNQMKKNNCKQLTPIAHGLTKKAWNNIWASISNKVYQDKSRKCKDAADARTNRIGFTHKLGAMGVAGLIKLFEAEFDRRPTEEEVAFAKKEGRLALFQRVKNRYQMKKTGAEVAVMVNVVQGKPKRKRHEVGESGESEEESASTSSSDEDEDISYKDTVDSSSSSSGQSHSEWQEGSEREVEGCNDGLEGDEESEKEEDETSSSDAATSDHAE